MNVGSLGDAFRVVMDRNKWSGRRLASELGTSQPWVSMVLAGQRDPGISRAADLLAQAGWELQLVPAGKDPVRRRAFLLAAASAAFIPSPSASPYTSPAYLDGITARLRHNESQLGGGPLAAEAARHAARALPAAQAGDPALRAAASRLCRQAALILHDVRQFARAEQTAAGALDLGRDAGDPAAQAEACDTLSLITAYLPGGRAEGYARRGLAVPGTGNGGRAVLAARLGRALAVQPGQGRAARASLEQALELAGQAAPAAEISGNAGIGFADLGMPGRAGPCLAEAVTLTAASPFERSLYVSRQAKTAIRARQPEQAAREMTALTALAPLVDSPRLSLHLRHIWDGTGRWDTMPEIRDARDALREVMT